MDRRRFLKGAGAMLASASALSPSRLFAQATPEATDMSMVDFMDIDRSTVERAHFALFMNNGTTFADLLRGSVAGLVGIGVRLRSAANVQGFTEGSYRCYVEWLAYANPETTARNPFEVSAGRQEIGDGASAWVWDMTNEDADAPWDEYQISGTAVWRRSDIQLLWGVSATGAPTAELLEIARSSMSHWNRSGGGILPDLNDLPVGMSLDDSLSITHLFRS